MRILLAITVFIILFLSSCISVRKFDEMRLAKEYWEQEADTADSLQQEIVRLEEEIRESNLQLSDSYHDLELLEATNRNLRRSYQEVLEKYNKIVNQSNEVVTRSSTERQYLTESLAQKQTLLDQKERELQDLEYMIRQREERLNIVQDDMNNMQDQLYQREQRISELSSRLSTEGKRMNNLEASMNDKFGNYQNDLDVSGRAGKIYLALSEALLFQSGSDKVGYKGRQVIKEIASTLNTAANEDLAIIVEGHTDADGTPALNWDLSARRATEVAQELIKSGVNPSRITAAGRGEYAPIVPNTSTVNKAKNRRVEIILSPNYDNLLSTLNR